MELKNALAVCLIAFFSATLVLLIARALDLQAASRLEPRLEEIAKELRAIREGGGGVLQGTGKTVPTDGLVVYYAHSNTRCPTCRKIESQSHEAVTTGFAEELASGKLKWEIVNYEKPDGKHFITDYDVQMPVIVLVTMKDGKPGKWRRLDEVWGLVDEKGEFIDYVQKEIRGMLGEETDSPKTTEVPPKPPQEDSVKIVPPADGKSDSPPLPDLPLPNN